MQNRDPRFIAFAQIRGERAHRVHARHVICGAAIGAFMTASAWAQTPAAPEVAPAAAAASQAVPGQLALPLPQAPSQRVTVEELLRKDSEAALAAIESKNSSANPIKPAPGATPAPGLDPANAPKPAAFAPIAAQEPVTMIQVDSIYGTYSKESDSRVVEATINGVSKTLRPGDIYAGMRLMSIKGGCASFAKEISSTSAVASTDETGKKSAKKASTATAARLAVRAKPRDVCIDDSPYGSGGDNVLSLPGAGGMPSPVYKPIPSPSLTLGGPMIPGQPVYPPAGTVSTGTLPIGAAQQPSR